MKRFTIRDLFWFVLVAALAINLGLKHSEVSRERQARLNAETAARSIKSQFEAIGFEFIERDGYREIRRRDGKIFEYSPPADE